MCIISDIPGFGNGDMPACCRPPHPAELAGCDGFLLPEAGCVVALPAESDSSSDIRDLPVGGQKQFYAFVDAVLHEIPE